MKNLIIILITVISFQIVKAQEFKGTHKYNVVINHKNNKKDYESGDFNIVSKVDNLKIIGTINVFDLDFLDDINISVLTNPKLINIKEIIKVDINYNACCFDTETNYYMITNTDESILLPTILNAYCEHTMSEIRYIFPVEILGEENIILKVKVNFEENFGVKNTETLHSIVWSDDDFYSSDEIDYSKGVANIDY